VNIFDLTLQLKGYPLKKARFTLQRLNKLDEAAFTAYVEEQKTTILNYTLAITTSIKSSPKIQKVLKTGLMCR